MNKKKLSWNYLCSNCVSCKSIVVILSLFQSRRIFCALTCVISHHTLIMSLPSLMLSWYICHCYQFVFAVILNLLSIAAAVRPMTYLFLNLFIIYTNSHSTSELKQWLIDRHSGSSIVTSLMMHTVCNGLSFLLLKMSCIAMYHNKKTQYYCTCASVNGCFMNRSCFKWSGFDSRNVCTVWSDANKWNIAWVLKCQRWREHIVDYDCNMYKNADC